MKADLAMKLFLILKTTILFMSQWINTGEARFHLIHHSEATVVWQRVSAQNATDEEDTPNIPTHLSASPRFPGERNISSPYTGPWWSTTCTVTGSLHNMCWELQVCVKPGHYCKLEHIWLCFNCRADRRWLAIISTRKRARQSVRELRYTRCGFSQSAGTLSTKLWL